MNIHPLIAIPIRAIVIALALIGFAIYGVFYYIFKGLRFYWDWVLDN